MTYTYRGTRVAHAWMPRAMANGVEDGQPWPAGFRFRDRLYRVGVKNRVLYRLGWFLGRLGMRVA